jgi:abhydrolase domain-containing protein 4
MAAAAAQQQRAPSGSINSNHSLELLPEKELHDSNWLPRWIPTSVKSLATAEKRLFNSVKTNIRGFFVQVFEEQSRIWTVTLKPPPLSIAAAKTKTPLVLIHGFAGGVGIWCRNFDGLATERTVHAFDLLGFGRSSRPKFPDDPTNAELEWVQSIEQWRKQMQIEKMILLGHSMGGFVASSYALEYPQHVRKLILVDPWGFPVKQNDVGDRELRLPTWVRTVATVLSHFNPLASVLVAGPLGPTLVRRVRPDLGRRYAGETGDTDAFFNYIYHCNAQSPSGEVAFKNISLPFGWAKRPMVDRLTQIDKTVPVTFICGGKSWMDSGSAYFIQNELIEEHTVNVKIVKEAGHHVYVDQPDEFNQVVRDLCAQVDQEDHDQVAVDAAHSTDAPAKSGNSSVFSL